MAQLQLKPGTLAKLNKKAMFQYRKRYGPVAKAINYDEQIKRIGFNTASGMAQLQQCPWNPAPGQG